MFSAREYENGKFKTSLELAQALKAEAVALSFAPHPAIEIATVDGYVNYLAEEVSKEKKDELWPLICSFYPDYETYQSNTSREIPVFLCKQL